MCSGIGMIWPSTRSDCGCWGNEEDDDDLGGGATITAVDGAKGESGLDADMSSSGTVSSKGASSVANCKVAPFMDKDQIMEVIITASRGIHTTGREGLREKVTIS